MESGGSSNSAIPASVMEAVRRTSNNIDELKQNLEEFLSHCNNQTLSKLEPLERAQALFLIAKATTILFTLRLRCSGVDIDDHPVKKELERLSLYEDKLRRCTDLSKVPLRPSVTINPQAAARFIEHALPDLTQEQRQTMRGINQRQSSGIKFLEKRIHKRKYQTSEKQSVQSEAQKFLEKATRELLGDNKNGIKGPLQLYYSNEDATLD